MFETAGTLLTAAVALAAIVGAILLLGWAVRRVPMPRPSGTGRALILRETLPLDASRRLHLVQHGDRAVLLLTGGAADIVVGWLDGPPPP